MMAAGKKAGIAEGFGTTSLPSPERAYGLPAEMQPAAVHPVRKLGSEIGRAFFVSPVFFVAVWLALVAFIAWTIAICVVHEGAH